MSYCRHEVVASELAQVIDQWYEFDPTEENQYELIGRARLIEQALELVNEFGVTQEDANALYKLAKEARERDR